MLALATSGGCYAATIHLSDEPGMRSTDVDGAFHLNLIDLIEISPPVNLQAACGGRPAASIDEGLTVLGAIVNIVLSEYIPVLSIMNTSVNCGGGGGGPPPAAGPPPGAPPGGQ